MPPHSWRCHTFKSRLEKVKAENQKHRSDKRAIAEKAGVPRQRIDNVWVSKQPTAPSASTSVVRASRTAGYGHCVMDRNGKVTYKRDPFDEYGAQNFEENRRESATREMAQMAMNQWAKNQRTPRMTQYENFEFKVDVRSGYDRDRDCIVTDMLIYDKHNKREHYHLVIDERGHELFSEWRMNH